MLRFLIILTTAFLMVDSARPGPKNTHLYAFDYNGKKGLLNQDGRIVKEINYIIGSRSKNGYIWLQFMNPTHRQYFNLNGQRVFKADGFFSLENNDVSEGLVPFEGYVDDIKLVRGYVNTQGKTMIRIKDEPVGHFSNGRARVRHSQTGDFGFIDKQGKYIVKPKFKIARNFSEGLAAVYNGKKWGYIDTTGKLVIKHTYSDASPFSEGLGAIRKDKKWGYINTKGKLIIKNKYDSAKPASEGLLAVKHNGKYIVLDKKGKPQFKSTYTYIGSYHGGLANARKGKKNWGYIDKKGKQVIAFQFDQAWPFSGPLAMVKSKNEEVYINRAGKIIIPR